MRPTEITGGFWGERLRVNARRGIRSQWEQLEASGCIENFRIAAGESEGFREGWFFADSDAYKWLEAVVRVPTKEQEGDLVGIVGGFIELLERTMTPDGYIFTYNQIHFPDTRWKNLQIEHELYCHGHLIEAGVSDYENNGETRLFTLARRAADRVVEDFSGKGPASTPGHEEIEIALIRLYRIAGDERYLDTARSLLERRGRVKGFAWKIARQYISSEGRRNTIHLHRSAFLEDHPGYVPVRIPPGNTARMPRGSTLRRYAEALSGRYFQQHIPFRRLSKPTGHAVCFCYLMTAAGMTARETGDRELAARLEQIWDRTVSEHLYITGGLGSVPGIEGFGRGYNLHPEYAYAETCAALGSIFWSREMASLTGDVRYDDLIEHQLYNGAGVGMGLEGSTYFYNNPLKSGGTITRRTWYEIACCPSNISRTLADLGSYICGENDLGIRIRQYVTGHFSGEFASLDMVSALPWSGNLSIRVHPRGGSEEFTLGLRIPSWSGSTAVRCNGEPINLPPAPDSPPTAGGFDPRRSHLLNIRRRWEDGDTIEAAFDMSIRTRPAHPKVRSCRGKAAVLRGPLVYCLESPDNGGVDLFNVRVDPESLETVKKPGILGGITTIEGRSVESEPLILVPYFLWGNRGPSKMTVYIKNR